MGNKTRDKKERQRIKREQEKDRNRFANKQRKSPNFGLNVCSRIQNGPLITSNEQEKPLYSEANLILAISMLIGSKPVQRGGLR